MRLLFVADGRSPIALNWMRYFLDRGDEIHLVSTFRCDPDPRFASYHFLPTAFSELKPRQNNQRSSPTSSLLRKAVGMRTRLRQWFGPLTLGKAARSLGLLIEEIHPNLVHAMRIPYEGMCTALAYQIIQSKQAQSNPQDCPLLISIWGNDFTLHASSTPAMGYYTRLALRHATALHADCQRDVRLARDWGFSTEKPAVVLPGAGGVQTEMFFPPPAPVNAPIVINPRGFRAYVNNAAFFQAIPLVLQKCPDARFLCTTMAGESQALEWARKLGIAAQVELLPTQTRQQMAELFRQSRVMVSPSNHDGTPNTLLEAMACGCFPVVGDLESLREWITPGMNGLLVDPNHPAEIAAGILRALEDTDLIAQAKQINASLIAERAEYQSVMRQAVHTYQSLIEIRG